jgi:hypothetical protein
MPEIFIVSSDGVCTITEPECFDIVQKPEHYNKGGIECIDAIEASMTPLEFQGHLKATVEKYMWRFRDKGKPVEDLKKARWYLDKLIERIENGKV